MLASRSVWRPGQLNDGRVMRSNVRWRSDTPESLCWNGEIVRLAIVIDAHDGKVAARRAVVDIGIGGSEVRDLCLRWSRKNGYSMYAIVCRVAF